MFIPCCDDIKFCIVFLPGAATDIVDTEKYKTSKSKEKG